MSMLPVTRRRRGVSFRTRAGLAAAVATAIAAMLAAGVRADGGAAALARGAWSTASIGALDRDVLDLALDSASCAVETGAVAVPSTLTVIDYSRPSTADRLWVFDVASRRLLFDELVAHGSGSGANFATAFSNDADSHQSSLGLFATAETYVGKNGYSLRLDGLEPGVNDRARARDIVMHGASYVSASAARTLGRLGRSWGCPALPDGIARRVIDRIKDGGLVFAYYPDAQWLRTSRFLGRCARPVS